ncbi:nucleotide sugar dehydrogenase [Aquibaculum sediminis]|uniref:nucleotide sugar dehydrogenase n=1 Tax=Aquibaculum sediminis TaxID=3231907 RepID=UPI003455C0DE
MSILLQPSPVQDWLSDLLGALQARSARIGIVGLGYVGLPLALRSAAVGFPVLGFDIDEEKVERLNAGRSDIEHIPSERVAAMRADGFEATADFARVGEADALILCVPTPLTRHREPDLGFVLRTMEALLPHLRPGQLISLESTTYPGTTAEELAPRIAGAGFALGEEIFLVYSPEREDPGNGHFDTASIPKVVGGHSIACRQAGVALYEQLVETVVPVSSTQAAEMTKLLENIHRAVNIGLVNEMKLVADRMGIDIFEVIDAAATKPFGFTPYYPGPGLGGHCIPIDPFYLTWKAREYGINTRFIELAGEINQFMREWVVVKLSEALNERGKSLKGSRVLVLGVAYKKNVDDMRESPSVEILERLVAKGVLADYSDPHVPRFPKLRQYRLEMASVPLTAGSLARYDAVLLLTDHDRFDYELIRRHAALIVDTRGRFRRLDACVVSA